jgi:acetoin utilization deacetylase AcuC-like enzyme
LTTSKLPFQAAAANETGQGPSLVTELTGTTAIYSDPRCLEHEAPGHPERPQRMEAALAGLRHDEAIYAWPAVQAADLSYIERVHSTHEVQLIAELARSGGGWVDPDTFVVPASLDAALLAAGAAMQATNDVLAGRVRNAFVVVRPPGHHATRTRAMGFCLFNNVAVAAQWAIEEGGAERVAVLDVDVHHGNGTQDIFYDRPDVLYYSTHQYPFYPGTGRVDDMGRNDGLGTTINVPLAAGSGDDIFLAATNHVLAPSVRRFAPNLILVSLGFDAHWADPLAQMRLTTDGYQQILVRIANLADELCEGRLILLLEGGYDLAVIEAGARMAGALLAGSAAPADPIGSAPAGADPGASRIAIEAAKEVHQLP